MSDSTPSGGKFRNAAGISAIKDGVKDNANRDVATPRKPPWLRVRVGGGEKYQAVRDTVHEHKLATVCEESHCPNIGECWSNGTATIMLMGLSRGRPFRAYRRSTASGSFDETAMP